MNWHDILKLKKYSEKDIKYNLLKRLESINTSTAPIVVPLFNLMYFNKPLTGSERMKIKRLASHTTEANVSTILNNISTAGGKIIESDRILPFSKQEMKISKISVYGAGNLYSVEKVEYAIQLTDKKNSRLPHILDHYLDVTDGLYSYSLIGNLKSGQTTADHWDFVRKIVYYYDTRKDCNLIITLQGETFKEGLYDPSVEEVIDWLREWEDSFELKEEES